MQNRHSSIDAHPSLQKKNNSALSTQDLLCHSFIYDSHKTSISDIGRQPYLSVITISSWQSALTSHSFLRSLHSTCTLLHQVDLGRPTRWPLHSTTRNGVVTLSKCASYPLPFPISEVIYADQTSRWGCCSHVFEESEQTCLHWNPFEMCAHSGAIISVQREPWDYTYAANSHVKLTGLSC